MWFLFYVGMAKKNMPVVARKNTSNESQICVEKQMSKTKTPKE